MMCAPLDLGSRSLRGHHHNSAEGGAGGAVKSEVRLLAGEDAPVQPWKGDQLKVASFQG